MIVSIYHQPFHSPHYSSIISFQTLLRLAAVSGLCSVFSNSVCSEERYNEQWRGGGGTGRYRRRETAGVREREAEQLLSFITCKRKSAVNCLPIAYRPEIVTHYPPSALLHQYIMSPSYHLSLVAHSGALQKDIS